MTPRAAVLAGLALLVASCSGPAAAPSLSPSPNATPTAVRSSPSATSSAVAFPDLTYVVGTNAGDLFFQLKDGLPIGRSVHVCSSAVRNLVGYARQAAFLCGSDLGGPQTLYLYDDATGVVTTVARPESSVVSFTNSGELAYVVVGATGGSAPIPMTKLMLYSIKDKTTAVIDERFGVAFELTQTTAGVVVWRPQNSLSFRRLEPDAGTWLLNGKSLARFSLHRLVAGYPGRYLLESEPVDANGYLSSAGSGSSYLVLRTDREARLTPPDVANEQAVDVLPDGRVFAWRPQRGLFDGTMVVYQDGKVLRQDPGKFGAFRLLHASDWVIGTEISGPPSTTFRAYRFSDGAFASMNAGNISSLGLLGPKN